MGNGWPAQLNHPLKVEKWELATTHSKPQFSNLVLTLKYSPQPEALEACEDGTFLFEIPDDKLIAMARRILGILDPVTNEQLLVRIHKLIA